MVDKLTGSRFRQRDLTIGILVKKDVYKKIWEEK